MACQVCKDIEERTDVPHVIRRCPECGREMHVLSPGKHGRGVQVRKGDRFVIPAGWMNLSIDPLRGTGRLTRVGLDMMARTLLLEGIITNEEGYCEGAKELESKTDGILNSFIPLAGLDVNNPADMERIISIMQTHRFTPEYWTMWTGQFLAIARGAREDGDVDRAMWATACAERCRAMMVFKQSLEDVVWMGHSAGRVIQILRTWDAHRENGDEGFWQATFNENSYVLSQVFAMPLVFIQDRAYVGGTRLDRSEARFIDYVFSAESSHEAILIEIKTPMTRLMGGTRYRGGFPPSRDLAGSVVQVLDYRHQLMQHLQQLTTDEQTQVSAFSPRCAVIIGNADEEFCTATARRSFELFRASLKDVEIVTYDELFRKVGILAELFGLKRTPPQESERATDDASN